MSDLKAAGRWDIDYHLPAEGILQFDKSVLSQVSKAASVSKDKRDPGKRPEEIFQYIDIASVDVATGMITNPQELAGEEAPSRARKVVRAFDILVSNVRPTRGAIAVVPPELHNQIASTGFTVLRPKPNTNPYYLHYAMRMPSTLEQFRKWSTGSSYPAILDADVLKTLIPVPSPVEQDLMAAQVAQALAERVEAMRQVDQRWNVALDAVGASLRSGESTVLRATSAVVGRGTSTKEIAAILNELPAIDSDALAGLHFEFDLSDSALELLAQKQ